MFTTIEARKLDGVSSPLNADDAATPQMLLIAEAKASWSGGSISRPAS